MSVLTARRNSSLIVALGFVLCAWGCAPRQNAFGPDPCGEWTSPQSGGVAFKYVYEPTHGLWHWSQPDGFVPSFTLFTSGRVVWRRDGGRNAAGSNVDRLYEAQLTSAETLALCSEIRSTGIFGAPDVIPIGPEGFYDDHWAVVLFLDEQARLASKREYTGNRDRSRAWESVETIIAEFSHPEERRYRVSIGKLFVKRCETNRPGIPWPASEQLLAEATSSDEWVTVSIDADTLSRLVPDDRIDSRVIHYEARSGCFRAVAVPVVTDP